MNNDEMNDVEKGIVAVKKIQLFNTIRDLKSAYELLKFYDTLEILSEQRNSLIDLIVSLSKLYNTVYDEMM